MLTCGSLDIVYLININGMTDPAVTRELLFAQQIASLDGLHLMGNVTNTFLRRRLGTKHKMIAELTRLDNFNFVSVNDKLSPRLNWFPFIQPRKMTL